MDIQASSWENRVSAELVQAELKGKAGSKTSLKFICAAPCAAPHMYGVIVAHLRRAKTRRSCRRRWSFTGPTALQATAHLPPPHLTWLSVLHPACTACRSAVTSSSSSSSPSSFPSPSATAPPRCPAPRPSCCCCSRLSLAAAPSSAAGTVPPTVPPAPSRSPSPSRARRSERGAASTSRAPPPASPPRRRAPADGRAIHTEVIGYLLRDCASSDESGS